MIRRNRRFRGQGLTENIVMVALIAVGCIGIVSAFGHSIRSVFGNSAEALAGNTQMSNTAPGSAGVSMARTLKNFGENDYGGSSKGGGGKGDQGPHSFTHQ